MASVTLVSIELALHECQLALEEVALVDQRNTLTVSFANLNLPPHFCIRLQTAFKYHEAYLCLECISLSCHIFECFTLSEQFGSALCEYSLKWSVS